MSNLDNTTNTDSNVSNTEDYEDNIVYNLDDWDDITDAKVKMDAEIRMFLADRIIRNAIVNTHIGNMHWDEVDTSADNNSQETYSHVTETQYGPVEIRISISEVDEDYDSYTLKLIHADRVIFSSQEKTLCVTEFEEDENELMMLYDEITSLKKRTKPDHSESVNTDAEIMKALLASSNESNVTNNALVNESRTIFKIHDIFQEHLKDKIVDKYLEALCTASPITARIRAEYERLLDIAYYVVSIIAKCKPSNGGFYTIFTKDPTYNNLHSDNMNQYLATHGAQKERHLETAPIHIIAQDSFFIDKPMNQITDDVLADTGAYILSFIMKRFY